MSVIPLSDGRDLEYELAGPEGPVVLFHHGMPGSAVHLPSVLDPLVERGFRVVTYSRSGYGNSTPSPGRTVADSARDCAQLLEKLGVDRYFSFGWSGGGPHGLASAAVDAGRVAGVVVSASFAPFDARGLDFVDGMGAQNHVQFGSVERGEQAMRDMVEQMAEAVRGRRADEVTSDLGSLFPEVDLVAMATGFGAENAASMDHGLRSGSEGWLADLAALSSPWGFDLDAVDVPVELWHGRLDKMVPVAHGEWLAGHVRRVVAHIEDGHGHISLTVGNVGPMLDALAARSD